LQQFCKQKKSERTTKSVVFIHDCSAIADEATVADAAARRRRLAHMSATLASSAHPAPLTSAKAIEVATMLGDSVVDVKHCIDPKGGKISSKTWGLAAAGFSCVLLSAVAFGASVKTASYNKDALDYWTHVAKKPAHAYRPHTLGFGYDWLAFGGFALGVGALAGSLIRMRRERRSPYYRIGTAPGVEQPVVGAPAESFPLVAPSHTGDDFVLNFAAGVQGEMTLHGGKTVPLAELAAAGSARASNTVPGAFELPIPMGSKIRASVGQTSFLVSAVDKPAEHKAPFLAGLESRTMAYFAGSLAAHLGVVMLLGMIPYDDSAAPIDLSSAEDTQMRLAGIEKEMTPPEEEKQENGDTGGEDSAHAAAMALESGQAGTPKSTNKDGQLQIKNNDVSPRVARQQAIDEARTAGVLGSVALTSGAMFSDITSDSAISSGFDTSNVWGPIYGSSGEGYGTFGYGRSGLGPGGGCSSDCGIIGTDGKYGRIGMGRFGREGYQLPGSGTPGRGGRQPKVPGPTIGQPETSGYDKSIIRRYIRRNVEKIAYCYEKQLLAKPGIEGTISVQFFISPTGSVKSSVGSGFDSEVANCVADVVSNIEFPKPPEGGAQVNYPFTFHATK
jgi:hypothetical protein